MSSMRRVGSSFLASSHIVWTQVCELRLASLGLTSRVATAEPDALMPALTPPPPAGTNWPDPFPLPPALAETAPGMRDLTRSFGLTGWMRLTNSDCPPKPQVSLNMHQAKIDGWLKSRSTAARIMDSKRRRPRGVSPPSP